MELKKKKKKLRKTNSESVTNNTFGVIPWTYSNLAISNARVVIISIEISSIPNWF